MPLPSQQWRNECHRPGTPNNKYVANNQLAHQQLMVKHQGEKQSERSNPSHPSWQLKHGGRQIAVLLHVVFAILTATFQTGPRKVAPVKGDHKAGPQVRHQTT
jgi:hypothetical protein